MRFLYRVLKRYSLWLSCQHAIDSHHPPGDKRLQAICQTDLGENTARV
jgi:hypothetical protein